MNSIRIDRAPYRLATLLLALATSACLAPKVVQYTAFQNIEHSPRTRPAEIHNKSTEELLNGGYLLIGYIDLRQNVRACYEDNRCQNISSEPPSRSDLQAEAAQRGGDVITLLEERTILEKHDKSVCTNTATSVTMVNGAPIVTSYCTAYRTIPGNLEAKISRALIWRHDPAAATSEANYQAIQSAMQSLAQTYRLKNEARDAEPEGAPPAVDLARSKNPSSESEIRREGWDTHPSLLQAILREDLTALQTLAREPNTLAWRDAKGRNALMIAVYLRKEKAARTLVESHSDPQYRDQHGYTALNYACANASLDLVKHLVSRAYNVQVLDKQGSSLLTFAAYNPDAAIVDWLLKQGLDPNQESEPGGLPILTAAAEGNLPVLKRLVAAGQSVNTTNKKGYTPLMAAAVRGSLVSLKWLLQQGGKVQARNQDGNTALILAAAFGQVGAMDTLLLHRARINEENNKGGNALIIAIVREHWDAALMLAGRNANLRSSQIDIRTVFDQLVKANQLALTELYLQKEPAVKDYLREHGAALRIAAEKGDAKMITLLAKYDAPLDRFDENGLTPLMRAAKSNNADAARALVELRANPHLKNKRGQTALRIATIAGHSKVVDALRHLGVRE